MSSWRDVEGQMQSYMRAQPGSGGFWANVAIVRPWVKVAAGAAAAMVALKQRQERRFA